MQKFDTFLKFKATKWTWKVGKAVWKTCREWKMILFW